MDTNMDRRTRTRSRTPRRLAFLAAVVAVFVTAVPGTASAATPHVTPLLDCYSTNSDGSVTVVLGYSSTYATTKTFAAGSSSNYTNPSSFNSQMPTTFKPGTYHLVSTVRVSAYVLNYQNPSWTLDGTTLNYYSAAMLAGTCSPSQLPALANGAAFAAPIIVAGVVGLLLIRRARRRTLATVGADSTDA